MNAGARRHQYLGNDAIDAAETAILAGLRGGFNLRHPVVCGNPHPPQQSSGAQVRQETDDLGAAANVQDPPPGQTATVDQRPHVEDHLAGQSLEAFP